MKNESTTTLAEQEISDDAILAYLNRRALESGIPGCAIKVGSQEGFGGWATVAFMVTAKSGDYGMGATIDEALVSIRKKLRPASVTAHRLLEEAKQKIDTAAELSRETVSAEMPWWPLGETSDVGEEMHAPAASHV